jgi:hypothetical protein
MFRGKGTESSHCGLFMANKRQPLADLSVNAPAVTVQPEKKRGRPSGPTTPWPAAQRQSPRESGRVQEGFFSGMDPHLRGRLSLDVSGASASPSRQRQALSSKSINPIEDSSSSSDHLSDTRDIRRQRLDAECSEVKRVLETHLKEGDSISLEERRRWAVGNLISLNAQEHPQCIGQRHHYAYEKI